MSLCLLNLSPGLSLGLISPGAVPAHTGHPIQRFTCFPPDVSNILYTSTRAPPPPPHVERALAFGTDFIHTSQVISILVTLPAAFLFVCIHL